MLHQVRLWLAYSVVLLIWSGTPLAIQWSATETGLAFSVAARMLIASVCAICVCLALRRPPPLCTTSCKAYLFMGLGFYVAMLGVYWASTRLNSGLLSVLFGLTPITTSLLACWLHQQRLSGPWALAGMALAVLGLAVIFSDSELLSRDGFVLGIAVALLAMLANAWTLVWIKQQPAPPPPLELTIGSIWVSTPLFLVSWWVVDGQLPHVLGLRAQLSILYLAVPGSLLAFVLYYYILRHMRAEQVAMILLFTPVLALAWGHYFNAEQLPQQTWIGSAMILLGLASYLRHCR